MWQFNPVSQTNPGELKILVGKDFISCSGQCKRCDTQVQYRLKRNAEVDNRMSEADLIKHAINRVNETHDCPAEPILPWAGSMDDFFRFGALMDYEKLPNPNNKVFFPLSRGNA